MISVFLEVLKTLKILRKSCQKLRKLDKSFSHAVVTGHFLEVLTSIGLDSKKCERHSLQSGGKSDKVKDNYIHVDIESKLSVSRSLGL